MKLYLAIGFIIAGLLFILEWTLTGHIMVGALVAVTTIACFALFAKVRCWWLESSIIPNSDLLPGERCFITASVMFVWAPPSNNGVINTIRFGLGFSTLGKIALTLRHLLDPFMKNTTSIAGFLYLTNHRLLFRSGWPRLKIRDFSILLPSITHCEIQRVFLGLRKYLIVHTFTRSALFRVKHSQLFLDHIASLRNELSIDDQVAICTQFLSSFLLRIQECKLPSGSHNQIGELASTPFISDLPAFQQTDFLTNLEDITQIRNKTWQSQ
jgi:hypothetical protein